MKRPEYILDRSSFTSTGALAREVMAWLEFSDCKIIVHVHHGRHEEELYNEMEAVKTMGRVRVERIIE